MKVKHYLYFIIKNTVSWSRVAKCHILNLDMTRPLLPPVKERALDDTVLDASRFPGREKSIPIFWNHAPPPFLGSLAPVFQGYFNGKVTAPGLENRD
jgi:hypothetical protein